MIDIGVLMNRKSWAYKLIFWTAHDSQHQQPTKILQEGYNDGGGSDDDDDGNSDYDDDDDIDGW